MQILRTCNEMRQAGYALQRRGLEVGLVPTMGALHAGHLSLVRAAQAECAAVAVSIFVNPTQFAAHEDYHRYPKTWDEDCTLLQAAGVKLLFAPSVEEMYPDGASAYVDVGAVGERLDGASRPGHMRGVATVVSKLFHIVSPDRAYFGQKDAAQVAVLQTLVRDLSFGVQLRVCPTVREPNGLAMSSRNRYLSAAELQQASALYAALQAAQVLVQSGVRGTAALRAEMATVLARNPEVRVDYVATVDPMTLLPVAEVVGEVLLAVAAWVGSVRLIDNIVVRGGGR